MYEESKFRIGQTVKIIEPKEKSNWNVIMNTFVGNKYVVESIEFGTYGFVYTFVNGGVKGDQYTRSSEIVNSWTWTENMLESFEKETLKLKINF